MSFKSARILSAFAALVIPGIMTAAPQLRLSQQVVGPISVAAGGNGGTVSLAALNIGDGALNLRASSSVPWLAPALGPSTTCVLQREFAFQLLSRSRPARWLADAIPASSRFLIPRQSTRPNPFA